MEREEGELTVGVPVRKSLCRVPRPTVANYSSLLPLSVCECEDGDRFFSETYWVFFSSDDGYCPKCQSSLLKCGPGSSVGIVTGQGSNPDGCEIFRTSPPSLLYNGYRVFPGGKEWPGRNADSSPPF